MENTEIRNLLLVSIQRALLGMIYPSIRAIAAGFDGLEKLRVIYYLDREPIEKDYENLNTVTGEICADIDFNKVEENCIYTTQPLSKLDSLDFWVYMREEK